MLQTYLTGKHAIECLESLITADIQGLPNGSGSLTVFTNQQGGILDDLIVNRVTDDFLYIVSNAACKEHDSALIKSTVDAHKRLGKVVDVKFFDPLERSLLALQGPGAVAALQPLVKIDLAKFFFMSSTALDIAGIKGCRVTRCGYTGEDGFEISIPDDHATFIAEALLDSKAADVKAAGLGARDSLRLEAGLCLYGSDIDTATSPVEAALAWLVAKRRRAERNFPGAEVIIKHLESGVTRRRVGIRMEKGPPARHGVKIFSDGSEIGEITSGSPSPSLGGNVGMGYVKEEFKKAGTKVELKIRDKFYEAVVGKMPFTKPGYYHKP